MLRVQICGRKSYGWTGTQKQLQVKLKLCMFNHMFNHCDQRRNPSSRTLSSHSRIIIMYAFDVIDFYISAMGPWHKKCTADLPQHWKELIGRKCRQHAWRMTYEAISLTEFLYAEIIDATCALTASQTKFRTPKRRSNICSPTVRIYSQARKIFASSSTFDCLIASDHNDSFMSIANWQIVNLQVQRDKYKRLVSKQQSSSRETGRDKAQSSHDHRRRTELRISKVRTPRTNLYYKVIKLDNIAKTLKMQTLFIFNHMFDHCDLICNPASRILYDYSQITIMYAFAFIKLWIFAMACKMHCWFTQTLYKAHRKRS